MKTPLDSRQLRAFCVLARTGSFTETARELHRTQSGISHSMKALEGDVGCRLLDRLGKKVLLTQAGEQLLQHAQKILQEMESAREMLGRLGKWGHYNKSILHEAQIASSCLWAPPMLAASLMAGIS
jgi:DNA-binding transcriptional LysR family regulator